MKISKDNISSVLQSLREEVETNVRKSEDSTAVFKKIQKVMDQILAYGINFEQHNYVKVRSGRTVNPTKDGIPKDAILYKEDGCYEYLYYVNLKTKDVYFSMPEVKKNVDDLVVLAPRFTMISHYKYIEELDILLGVNLALNEETAMFENTQEYSVLTRDKTVTYMNLKDKRFGVSCYCAHMIENDLENDGVCHSLPREFEKMFKQPIVNVGANNFVVIDSIQGLNAFLEYNAKLEVKNGPKQRKIDELVSIDLPDKAFTLPENAKYKKDRIVPYDRTVIQRVKENTAVIRWRLYGTRTNVSLDGLRIYIEGKDVYACKLNNNGVFVRTNITNIKPANFLSCEMDEVNKEDLKGTILEYYGEIINDIPDKYKSVILLAFIKTPKVEQLFKMGLHTLVYEAIRKEEYNILPYVETVFKIPRTETAKNIHKYLGVNKYQFECYKKAIEELCTEDTNYYKREKYFNLIYYIKTILGTDISSIDNKTFDAVFEGMKSQIENSNRWYYRDSVEYTCEYIKQALIVVNRHGDNNLIKHFTTLIPKLLSLPNDYSHDVRLYYDYVSMVSRIDDWNNFKLSFDDYDDIRRMHDAANSIYNLNRETYNAKAFKDNLVKVEKLKYQNEDDDFCVVIPNEANDLAKEGLELKHCVKSYISRVASGSTNIVFIRKKGAVDKPFFTVEVSNDKVIEQIHGFANRNMDTEPNLTEFVNKWAKNKKLKLVNVNKVR